jgi:rod shape-determining protein MreC
MALVVLIGVIMAGVIGNGYTAYLEYGSSYLLYPVLLAQNQVVDPIKMYFKKRKTVHELQAEVARLQAEHQAVIAESIELQSLISCFEDTKELIDFKKRYSVDESQMVHIIARHFEPQTHYFIIDAGQSKGIVPGMVAVFKDCLVGKVAEVYPWYSKVVLVTDSSCKVGAYCAKSKAGGIYEGANQEWQAHLTHISHLSQLQEKDLILSSGEGLVFPRGFGLGTIKEFSQDGLFYTITLEPLLDLRSLNYCYVIQKGKDA